MMQISIQNIFPPIPFPFAAICVSKVIPSRISKRTYASQQRLTAAVSGYMEEMITGQRDVKVFNCRGKEIEKEVTRVIWDVEAAEKGGYEHFMLKEIMVSMEKHILEIIPKR